MLNDASRPQDESLSELRKSHQQVKTNDAQDAVPFDNGSLEEKERHLSTEGGNKIYNVLPLFRQCLKQI